MIPWKNLENFAKTDFHQKQLINARLFFPRCTHSPLIHFLSNFFFLQYNTLPHPTFTKFDKGSHTPPRAWPQRMEERARQTNAQAISQNSQNQLTHFIQQPPTQKHYKSFPVQSHPKHHVENLLSRRLTFTHTFILSIETVFYDPRYYLKTFMLDKSLGRQQE